MEDNEEDDYYTDPITGLVLVNRNDVMVSDGVPYSGLFHIKDKTWISPSEYKEKIASIWFWKGCQIEEEDFDRLSLEEALKEAI